MNIPPVVNHKLVHNTTYIQTSSTKKVIRKSAKVCNLKLNYTFGNTDLGKKLGFLCFPAVILVVLLRGTELATSESLLVSVDDASSSSGGSCLG